ncbi:hypothetical protein FB446DRAFT_712109 [Lentinula raphanica]|nr:hypothetical protein FB446DRAFT_712109 [Lentinula raphanica]
MRETQQNSSVFFCFFFESRVFEICLPLFQFELTPHTLLFPFRVLPSFLSVFPSRMDDSEQPPASSQPKPSWGEVLPQLQDVFKPEYLEAAIKADSISSVVIDDKFYILSPVSLPVVCLLFVLSGLAYSPSCAHDSKQTSRAAATSSELNSSDTVIEPKSCYPDCTLDKDTAFRILYSVLHKVKENNPFASAPNQQISAAWKRVHQHYLEAGGKKQEKWLKTKVNAFIDMHEVHPLNKWYSTRTDLVLSFQLFDTLQDMNAVHKAKKKRFTKLVIALFEEHRGELRTLLEDISRQRAKTMKSNSEDVKENLPSSSKTPHQQHQRLHEEVQLATSESRKKARATPHERKSMSNTPDIPVARATSYQNLGVDPREIDPGIGQKP